jgi:hypothetical protein
VGSSVNNHTLNNLRHFYILGKTTVVYNCALPYDDDYDYDDYGDEAVRPETWKSLRTFL